MHDIRAFAASKAFYGGVSVDQIMQSCDSPWALPLKCICRTLLSSNTQTVYLHCLSFILIFSLFQAQPRVGALSRDPDWYFFISLSYLSLSNLTARQGCLFVFTEVRLITAAAPGLWSPLNNFLAFHIFLSLLRFFKTMGAGKIFGILCADLKLYLR